MSLRHALLVLLAERPHTGYELSRRMREPVGWFWSAAHSQIYPELASMDRTGLVTFTTAHGPGPREKKSYRVTESGRAELRGWLVRSHRPRPSQDPLVLAAFGAMSADLVRLADRFREEIERLDELLAEYREVQRRLDEMPGTSVPTRPEFGWELALHSGVHGATARRAWCREVVARLEVAGPGAT